MRWKGTCEESKVRKMPSRKIYMAIDKSGRGVIPHVDRRLLGITPGAMITLQIIEIDGEEI